ncbi:MAG: pyridoxal phosphate-dependent aminotransferase [Rickettsiales bacterium]|nr:pyridoxal phosphate-dependent aminotransferase [Rickettsiales bacterium]
MKKISEPKTVAARLHAVKPSPTMAITAKAAEMKAAGKDVIGLGAGEPDFDTPEHIKEAAIEALRKGDTKYTPVAGTPALKDAIIAKFKRENHLTYTRQQVLAGVGAKQVIFNAFLATLDAGDEVIIPAPYWVSYPDMVIVAEGKPTIVICHEADDFKITPQQLEAAITPRTRWLILNSPSNPTGMAYTEAELKALAAVLLKHPQVMIMADDIYEHLTYDGFIFKTLAEVEPALFERTLTVNGVSKAYSMTGWRIGYAGGPNWLINAIADLQSHSTSNPCSIAQAASVAALNGTQEFLVEWRAAFKRRRDLVIEKLNASPFLHCKVPHGAFYVFPNCEKTFGKKTPSGQLIQDSADLCTYLIEEALVAAVPGSAFGLDGYFRISTAKSDADLTEACARIVRACAALV